MANREHGHYLDEYTLRQRAKTIMAHIRLYLLFKCSPVVLQALNARHVAGCCPVLLAARAVPALQDGTAVPPCPGTPMLHGSSLPSTPMNEILQQEEGRGGTRHRGLCPHVASPGKKPRSLPQLGRRLHTLGTALPPALPAALGEGGIRALSFCVCRLPGWFAGL